ncbi:hypothetical protein JKP88DRAFT_307688 [Tribonema minus]|uniref:Transposase n=1 Tax=Tribonema minus TaxID=303371 RepID=A0A835ZC03_9STRA|nr:hypothetical protein JKP88DRAFT_307688 [Tribonema minus]
MMLPLDDRIVTSVIELALDNIQPIVRVPTLKDFLSAERGTRAEWRALQQEGVRSRQVRKDWKTRLTGDMTERGWWLCMLNLHDKVRVRVPRGAERSGEARMKPLGRKGKLAWGGIRSLWGQRWTIEGDLREYGHKAPPWLVNNITTDGLQVNVTLATKRVETVIPGVAELIEKGYTSINDVYKADTHTRGLFGSAEKMSDQVISALNKKDRRCFIEAVGVDSGQKLLYTAAAARISSDTSSENFKKIQPAFRSASDHKFLSLSKAWRKFEGEAFLGEETQKFRCQEGEDAGDIEDGGTAAALRKIGPEPEEREALLTRMRDNLAGDRRTWTRVVFFGNAQFGHGSRGPLPRKALIRAIALLVPVVLMNEFRTSKACCGCGKNLVQVNGSRVFRCISCTPEGDNLDCSVRFIDRDINASVNIAICGINMLLGRTRPQHLCRGAGEEEDA